MQLQFNAEMIVALCDGSNVDMIFLNFAKVSEMIALIIASHASLATLTCILELIF